MTRRSCTVALTKIKNAASLDDYNVSTVVPFGPPPLAALGYTSPLIQSLCLDHHPSRALIGVVTAGGIFCLRSELI